MTITRITRNYFQSRTNELTHDFKRMIVIKNSNTDDIKNGTELHDIYIGSSLNQ